MTLIARVILLVMLSTSLVGQAQEGEPDIRIDHIIWAVPDLDTGADFFTKLSGIEPVVGGTHPGRGTRNKLIGVGDNMYLEVLAPDPQQMPLNPAVNPAQAFADTISRMAGPEIDMFAFSSSDLASTAEAGRSLGLKVVGPTPGQRRTPDGELIRWSSVDFAGHDFGQFIPFGINWLDSTHPSTAAPQGVVIEGITVEHPRADELRRIYEGLKIPAKVVIGEQPVIIIHMRSDKGTFELRSGQSLFKYYAAPSDDNN